MYTEKEMLGGNKYSRQQISSMGLNKDSVFIDGGSHRGEELVVLAEIGCEVHGFEVNSIHCENLKNIYSGCENIKINHAALWVEDTYIDVYEKLSNNLASMSTETAKGNIDISKKSSVKAIDIASYILSLDKEVDVMKLDIEGGEYKVIRHLIETEVIEKIKVIYFEDHEVKMRGEEGALWKAEKIEVNKLMSGYKHKFRDWH